MLVNNGHLETVVPNRPRYSCGRFAFRFISVVDINIFCACFRKFVDVCVIAANKFGGDCPKTIAT